MDIKATKLQNTQQTTSSTTVQTPTKTADGKSFIDEMISLPELRFSVVISVLPRRF